MLLKKKRELYIYIYIVYSFPYITYSIKYAY